MQTLNAYVKEKVNKIKLVMGKVSYSPQDDLERMSWIRYGANDWIQGSTKLWPLLS